MRGIALTECMNSWCYKSRIGLQQSGNTSRHEYIATVKTGIDLRYAPELVERKNTHTQKKNQGSCPHYEMALNSKTKLEISNLLVNALVDWLLNGSGCYGQVRHGTNNVNSVHQRRLA